MHVLPEATWHPMWEPGSMPMLPWCRACVLSHSLSLVLNSGALEPAEESFVTVDVSAAAEQQTRDRTQTRVPLWLPTFPSNSSMQLCAEPLLEPFPSLVINRC